MALEKDLKAAKRKLLDDSESESDNGGAVKSGFSVNEEFARRFEHNKKREERQRLEEKFKNDEEDDEDSSEDESEDENGFLATEDLDAQISATLHAIKNKDPRVYDKDQTFYKPDDETDNTKKEKKEKPIYLRDYHREKLLRGDTGADDEDELPQTYQQEQDAAKNDFLSGVKDAEESSDSDSDDAFVIKKKSDDVTAKSSNGVHPSRATKIKIFGADVGDAQKDPETFLSNFMAARAWVVEEGGRWKAFESDDGEADDDGADEFEQAYNMRFEDPEKSREVLRSYARDITNSRSVRREHVTGRKHQRELERERKEVEKKERSEDKARLRKLKLEEAEQKLRKIRHAAGAAGKELSDAEWMSFLDGVWDNDNWEAEMQKRFGDDYYAAQDDAAAGASDEDAAASRKSKPKKPKWDDDIDIGDIVPDFEGEENKAKFALSDAEEEEAEEEEEEEEDDAAPAKKKRKTADIKKERINAQKRSKKERAQLEALVDSKIELTDHRLLKGAASSSASSHQQQFRYRETSPQSFGMTARDILLAPSDAALNDFAGLKKLAPYRDVDKKRRDRKHLGKKARLRQWRADTFGRDYERTGPTFGFERYVEGDEGQQQQQVEEQHRRRKEKRNKSAGNDEVGKTEEGVDEQPAKKKRKRSKGNKSAEVAA